MKMSILSILFFSLFASLTAPSAPGVIMIQPEAVSPYMCYVHAISNIESANGKYMLNEKEQATGWFGIRPIRLDAYNRATGSLVTLNECNDYETGKKILLYYISQVDYRDIKGVAVAWNGKSIHNKYYAKLKATL